MKTKLLLSLLLVWICLTLGYGQTNAPSIQSGVTFQWSDVQTAANHSATIQSVTVNGIVYLNFGLPTGYELTQLGPDGHNRNRILNNGTSVETTSSSATWGSSALTAFQDLNLNHYFNSNRNGANICDNYTSESTTTAQRQTLTYGTGILATSSGVIAVTERNANNCLHLELFGIPAGGGPVQSLGETFINETSTQFGFGGTGTGGPNGLGTPGALNPPNTNSDYWLSDRVVENKGTLGIALFYLDDIAPNGSLITKAQLTASTRDHADGKLFIFTLDDQDEDGYSDVDDLDDDNDGIKDTDESGGIDPSADADTDGIPNYKDADFCTLNAHGVCANLDADSDGIPNHLDLDSDNDGITDVKESGGIDLNNDGMADGSIGITPTTNGIPSSAGTGTTPINTDGDVNGSGNRYLIYDFLDIDSDNDGIPDNIEAQPTVGYVAPSGTYSSSGIDVSYGLGIMVEDTDGDGIPDYIDSDSDNDGIADLSENGLPVPSTDQDKDADGLINPFETTNIDDPVWDVNEDIEDPTDLSILPDADGDLNSGGDLDYRDMFSTNPPSIASIDFDGIDDYLSRASFINGLATVTIMAWVKSDTGNATNMVIAGEDSGCKLWLEKGNIPKFTVKTAGNSEASVSCTAINFNEWHHITGIYNSTSGAITIYVDGTLLSSGNVGSTGAVIENTVNSNGNFEVGRRSSNLSNKLYFKGDIDEVRVFNTSLTSEQVQKMVYQEIEENTVTNNVKGVIAKKDIEDTSTGAKVPWANLIAYYPMTDIKMGTTSDYSSNNEKLYLNYINTVQDQTAPMPYQTASNGAWTSQSTWLHGDVWDIENIANNKDWSIVKIGSDVSACHPIKTVGLVVDSGHSLNVQSDNLVENSWYLELNGTLNLEDDSQLIQTEHSDLVTSAVGKILRRQEGTSSMYRYNYWASPVGAIGLTALSNNNATTNNPNNTAYTLNSLKDEMGINFSFTSSHHEMGKISTYWLYTYINGLTYWDWAVLDTNTPIEPGVGYTQKGTGNAGLEQQYTFEGKPNNGTILINVTDKGGPGSEPSVSKTEYLLGNPYPSALDIHKFIDDNAGVIDGTLQLWQQWAGDSHQLRDYEGGYAQVNKTGSIRAYQFVGIEGANNGSQDGTITPSRYLPVGQGFITEIVGNGHVEFNNSQRVFIKEADADGTYNNGSSFFRNGNDKTKNKNVSAKNNEQNEFKKMRLELNAVSGPATRRELLLGFSNETTDGFDYGYEAECTDSNNNDLNLNFEGKNMNIQAYSDITNEKVVALNFKSSDTNTFEIKMTETENIDETQEIYLRDNLTGTYFDLTENQPYSFTSEQGKFNKRFEIVFQSEQKSLSIEESKHHENFVYFQNKTNTLFAKKLSAAVNNLAVISMKGQTVFELQNVTQTTLNNGLKLVNMATGTYIVCLRTEDHQVITKKIIIH
ncbi:LamG-like jellyroll fold domain-containing protein [Hwangdonia lutea]|uniref:LamG-like jellyroll fold domain-containing protein n=1 Tax=Hwangdonia lutea TaxID=3075823 RepID=A0AA97HS49_9FLAO|nr:LamG-like jellyroll fold domain-containing protein [Hwangdonia sp. SCSIO 19198]WOD44715.1 LamG-like jellyroll fold domain-containing protein [Hwangdonia sp. SCSIO 19198]